MSPRPIEEQILDHYQSLMRHVADTHAHEFLTVDVTMSQAKVLYIASLRPGIGMTALASELGVGLSAVSGLVDRLVVNGYLERREDASDRRQQLVTLTVSGTRALDRLRELRAELVRRLLVGLDTHELVSLRDGVAALDREAQAIGEAPVIGEAQASPDSQADPIAQPERTTT